MQAGISARYRALQQEADFALWRAREAGNALREKYAAALRGEGAPPTAQDLAQLHEAEAKAETRYRELREFLRAEFDRLEAGG
jgi:hypothetical protein